MNHIYSSLLCLLMYGSLQAYNGGIFIIDQNKQQYNGLNAYLQILPDTSGTKTLEEIVESKFLGFYDSIIQSLGKNKQSLDKNTVYWGKITISNQLAGKNEWILWLGGKRHSDIADVWITDTTGKSLLYRSGMFVKSDEKAINEEWGSKIPLVFEGNETKTLYIKIHNISGFKPRFQLSIESVPSFDKKVKQRNLWQGLIQGAMWMIFLYNLLIFFLSRDRTYLFYALYIMGLAINAIAENSLLDQLFIGNYPTLNPYIFVTATGIANIAYFQFIRRFLDTGKKYPRWDNAHRIVMIIKAVEWIMLLVILLFNFNLPLMLNVSNVGNLLVLLYGLVFMGALLRTGDRLAMYFVIGTLALAIGTITYLVFLLGNIQLSYSPQYFLSAGTLGELLLFSLGLGYRMRLLEKEKLAAQAQLIVEYRRNAELQEKVNRELEFRVKERTAEIEQQKEEILAQRDEIERQRDKIMDQNKNITDSIVYAKRIQNAVLPPEANMNQYLSQYFVLFKPRDIVSGDFYWIKRVEDKLVVMLADCTGHGVPGAFMSMLGIAFLNEIVADRKILNPDEVLDLMRQRVIVSLRQEGGRRSDAKDGMNAALCVFDLAANTLTFAGAYHWIMLVNKETNATQIIKGDKMPVGVYFEEHKPFTRHTININKGDIIYLTSDGYPDQFGGPDGRKFLTGRFQQLLLQTTHLDMNQQKMVLEKHLRDWQGVRPQIDDILVMGIRL